MESRSAILCSRTCSGAGWLSPVCGNLFHHAIEAFLKARLSQNHPPKDLKKLGGRTGHELPLLWTEFKGQFPGAGRGEFDHRIAGIERFERLRYPDAIVKEGARISIAWEPHAAADGGQPKTARPEPFYEIVASDIDRLVSKLFYVCSRNPAFFTTGLNDCARDALTRHNPFAAKLVRA